MTSLCATRRAIGLACVLNEAAVVERMHSSVHFPFIHQEVHLRIAAAVLQLLIMSHLWQKRPSQSHSLKAKYVKDPSQHCDF